MKGCIVLLNALCGKQPVFREDDRLMFFKSHKAAQAEIDECLDGVKEAIADGDMEGEYDDEEYIIADAKKVGNLITCTYNGRTHQMLDTDEDWERIN